VILDVVYNHFGPDGNYVGQFSPYYFQNEDVTPWGDAINFSAAHNEAVRAFFKSNLDHWITKFHIDGFRLDATHAIIDRSEPHILAELAELAHSRGRYMIAEDERNEARIITSLKEDGFGFDGVWADDFHHTLEVALVDASRYREDFVGEMHEAIEALQNGWIYQGQESRRHRAARGTACRHLPPERFILCISNHDQVGNRAFGERLNHLVSPSVYRAASALLLLSPYTPLLFQGQEWAASTPFLYFTDHHEELGRAVEAGRREECRFEVFARGETHIPSPQDADTFQRSKLVWEEIGDDEHGKTLELYRELIRIRRTHTALRPSGRESYRFTELPAGVLAMIAVGAEETWLMLCDLRGGHSGTLDEDSSAQTGSGLRWVVELSTNERRFGGQDSDTQFDPDTGAFHFAQPGVLLLRAQR
jgi:maltooligosyltrehalose trehalohydrolase